MFLLDRAKLNIKLVDIWLSIGAMFCDMASYAHKKANKARLKSEKYIEEAAREIEQNSYVR